MPKTATKTSAAPRAVNVGFVITGEFFTRFVRDLVLEGKANRALRVLMDDLRGMTHDIAVKILKGEASLIGRNGYGVKNTLRLKQKADAAYQAELARAYGGCFEDAYGAWRPYAFVTSYGPDDMAEFSRPHARGSDVVHGTVMGFRSKDDVAPRALYYADDTHKDRVHFLNLPDGMRRDGSVPRRVAVLFRKVELPFWIQPDRDPQLALDAYLSAGCMLHERGAFPHAGGNRGWQMDTRLADAAEAPSLDVDEEGFASIWTGDDLDVAHDGQGDFRIRENGDTSFLRVAELGERGVANAVFKLACRRKIEFSWTDAKGAVHVISGDGRPRPRLSPELKEKVADIAGNFDAYFNAFMGRDRSDAANARRRVDILRQAEAAGFIEVEVPESVLKANPRAANPLRIPRAPFEQWCLWRTAGAHLATPWQVVSPSGLKLFGDDPFHSDWMIGAGLEFHALQHGTDCAASLRPIIDELHNKIQKEKLGFACAVLSGRGVAIGRIVHPKPGEVVEAGKIAVIPHAGPEYVDAALSAAAVITERGGQLAHLVNVAREKDKLIVRVEGARRRYPAGVEVEVDAETGRVDILPGPLKTTFDSIPPWEA